MKLTFLEWNETNACNYLRFRRSCFESVNILASVSFNTSVTMSDDFGVPLERNQLTILPVVDHGYGAADIQRRDDVYEYVQGHLPIVGSDDSSTPSDAARVSVSNLVHLATGK